MDRRMHGLMYHLFLYFWSTVIHLKALPPVNVLIITSLQDFLFEASSC